MSFTYLAGSRYIIIAGNQSVIAYEFSDPSTGIYTFTRIYEVSNSLRIIRSVSDLGNNFVALGKDDGWIEIAKWTDNPFEFSS